MIRLSDFVIDYFYKIGIRHVFTVSGGGSIFLCDALYRAKKLKYVCNHHEQAVAIAKAAAESTTVGDPRLDDSKLGPVVNKTQFDKIQKLIHNI